MPRPGSHKYLGYRTSKQTEKKNRGKTNKGKGLNKDEHAYAGRDNGRRIGGAHIYIESTWRCTFPVSERRHRFPVNMAASKQH